MRTEKMKGVLLAATIAAAAAAANSAALASRTAMTDGVIASREEDVDGARPPPPVTNQQRRRRQRRRLVDRPETGIAHEEEEGHLNHRKHHLKTTLEPATAAGGAKLSMRTHAPQITNNDDESTTVMSSMSMSSSQQHEDEKSGKSGKSKSDKSSKKVNDDDINNDATAPPSSASSHGNTSSSGNPTCTSPLDSNCIVPVPVPIIIDGQSTSSPGVISSSSLPSEDGIDGGGTIVVAPPTTSSPLPSTSTSTTTTVPHLPTTSTSSYPSSSKSPTSITSSSSSTTTNATTTLTWKGVNGCTPLTPCPPCTGDCDTDADCTSDASIVTTSKEGEGNGEGGGTTTTSVVAGVTQYTGACYKRSDGSNEQIPGCSRGGSGDIPGADYCYAKVLLDLSYHHPPDDDNVVGNGGEGNETSTTTPSPTPTTDNNNSPNNPPMTLAPASGDDNVDEKISSRPSSKNENNNDGPYYFIQSRIDSGSSSTSNLGGYCIGGALSPDYYQLVIEECTSDSYYNDKTAPGTTGINGQSWDDAYVTTRLVQLDQLWYMDNMGYIRSAFDSNRCMTVLMSSIIEQQEQQQQQQNSNNNDDVVEGDSGGLIAKESPVEIGPCTSSTTTNRLSRFIYPKNANEFVNGAVPKLRLRGFENYCITFLLGSGFIGNDGIIVPKGGAPVVLGNCPESTTITGEDEDSSYGWDFVSEHNNNLATTGTTVPPTSVPLPLRYLGRDACNPVTPCHECMGDCDTDDDCSTGLTCFEREKDEYTVVPGCGTGGPGDIPGADYCYDSTPDNSDVGDNTGLDPSTPPLLRWLGSEGCSPSRPCGACSGDCDEDDDCIDRHECFKRYVGETTAVPGCDVGGSGDIPGGDYCYDTDALVSTTGSSSSSSSSSSSTLDGSESTRPTPQTQPPRPAPSAPFNAIVNGMNTQATGGDGTVIEERIRQPALTRHNIMHDSAKTHKEKEDEQ